jgi:F0F1-type ATP synthase membrane subunit c/vacuolar-type H+-ATPase subunit K
MRPRDNRGAGLIWIGLAAAAAALIGAIAMVRSPSSEVLGSSGRPEGWFGLLFILMAIFFFVVYRNYAQPRALKLAALMGIGALVSAFVAKVTLPPDCGQLSEQGLPVACLDVYGRNPDAVLSPSTWGIWLLAIGGLICAGAAIVALYSLAEGAGSQPAPARPVRPRRTPAERAAERRAASGH